MHNKIALLIASLVFPVLSHADLTIHNTTKESATLSGAPEINACSAGLPNGVTPPGKTMTMSWSSILKLFPDTNPDGTCVVFLHATARCGAPGSEVAKISFECRSGNITAATLNSSVKKYLVDKSGSTMTLKYK